MPRPCLIREGNLCGLSCLTAKDGCSPDPSGRDRPFPPLGSVKPQSEPSLSLVTLQTMKRPDVVQMTFIAVGLALISSLLLARHNASDPHLHACMKLKEAADVIACQCRSGFVRNLCDRFE